MVKKIIVVCFISLIFLLAGCSPSNVSDSQVEMDFVNLARNSVVNEITIDKKEHNDESASVEITADMTAPNAEIHQAYRLIYYYLDDTWVFQNCVEIDDISNCVVPTEEPDWTNEDLCKILFSCDKGVGCKLSAKIKNAHFTEWVQTGKGYNKSYNSNPLNFIENVEYLKDFKNNICSAIVYLKASTTSLSIKETVQLQWSFNANTLTWELRNLESIDHSLEPITEITGEYISKSENGKKIVVDSYDDDSIYTTVYYYPNLNRSDEIKTVNVRYFINGLYKVDPKLSAYAEALLSSYGIGYFDFYNGTFSNINGTYSKNFLN